MLRPDGDSGLRPPRDLIFGPLGVFLGPHVGPMLAPCWPHVGSCWASWAILAGSWSDFELILKRFLLTWMIRRKEEAGFSKNLQKQSAFQFVLEVTSIDFGSSWGSFWNHLGGLGAVLEASWASWGRLDGFLGRLGVHGNA